MDNADTMIDQNRAAEILGLRPRSMESLRARGCGPVFHRIGRSVRYRLADVVAYRDRDVVRPAETAKKCTGDREAA